MSLITEQLHNLVKEKPKARERKYKNEAIAFILMRFYSLDIQLPTLSAIVSDALLLDRDWRKFLEDNKEYRGTDYEEKVKLAQKKKVELGYAPQPLKDSFEARIADPDA